MGVELNWPNRDGYPDYHRRQAEFNQAIGDLWLALAGHPIFRRLGPIRREFERRAIQAFWRAAELDREALELLALKPKGKA